MLISTFWKIIVRIIGLFFLFACFTVVAQTLPFLAILKMSNNWVETLEIIGLALAGFGLLGLLVWACLFRSEWIVAKLKLDSGFNEDRIALNVQPTVIVQVALIVVGALMLVDAVPGFIARLFRFMQQKLLFREYGSADELVFDLVKAVVGYLVFTNSKWLSGKLRNFD